MRQAKTGKNKVIKFFLPAQCRIGPVGPKLGSESCCAIGIFSKEFFSTWKSFFFQSGQNVLVIYAVVTVVRLGS